MLIRGRLAIKQSGGALLIALIIVAAVSILSGSLLYVIKINIMQNNAINRYNDLRNASFLALKDDVNKLGVYSNEPADSNYNYTADSGTITVSINNQAQSVKPLSHHLYNAFALMQYKALITTTKGNNSINYSALVNIPSSSRPVESEVLLSGIPTIETQNINVPAVIVENLKTAQLNSSLSYTNAGFIGTLTVNNTLEQLIYTPYPAISPASYYLDLPENDLDPDDYRLEQGWLVKGGDWKFYILVYDKTNSYAYQTSIDLDTLITTPSNFSSLSWNEILSPSSGGGNVFGADDKILSIKYINDYDKIYGFTLVKNIASNDIKGFTLTNAGVSMSGSVNYGDFSDVDNVYILPIDVNANQAVNKLMVFMSDSDSLESVFHTSVSNGHAQSYTNLGEISAYGALSYPPQLIYRNSNSDYLILPFGALIRVYTYDLSSPSLTYQGSVSFALENVEKILPFNGFIIVVTDALKAYFIQLSDLSTFATYNLTSSANVYTSYDDTSYISYLHTTNDAIDIKGAPTSYGVISMQTSDN
ncbi:hypothetical protein [Facilibium subflavum]|uniref:hypothetical protein n=1 Tax=Facilibium subflavum TaxID=2219058 RepID=UPI000E6469CE|nr:hypothetical protein [Facilibium subflavum]